MSKISISKLFILQVMAGDFSSSVKTFSSLLSYWQLLSEEEECCQSDGKMKNSDDPKVRPGDQVKVADHIEDTAKINNLELLSNSNKNGCYLN